MLGFQPQNKPLIFNKMPLKREGVQKSSRIRQAGSKPNAKAWKKRSAMYVEGDTLVVWRLEQARPLSQGPDRKLKGLHHRKMGFKSLTENIDTSTPGGKLIFHMFGALAEFERDLIKERTNAGLQAARARGRRMDGQKPSAPKKHRWRKRCMLIKPIASMRFARHSISHGRACTGI